jgi:hypothetical protein
MEYRLSHHARQECERRQIPLDVLDAVMTAPEQICAERDGAKAYQSLVKSADGRTFLVRAIVNDRQTPPVVITAYRTTKTEKYWRVQ